VWTRAPSCVHHSLYTLSLRTAGLTHKLCLNRVRGGGLVAHALLTRWMIPPDVRSHSTLLSVSKVRHMTPETEMTRVPLLHLLNIKS